MPIPRPPLVLAVAAALGAFLVASVALTVFIFPLIPTIDDASRADFSTWQAQQQAREVREE